jgi:putative flavoprotein involved in K+ transport
MTQQAEDTARQWLAALEARLAAQDVEGAVALFRPDGFWRDMLAFTWNIETAEGAEAIAALLRGGLAAALPVTFTLEAGTARSEGEVIEAWFGFETRLTRGRGHLRLTDGLGWTILTAAQELKGHEEATGRHRPRGVEHGAHPGRQSWLDLKQARQAALGDTKQPYCLIVGGSQGGLALAARLNRLGVSNLVIDKLPRPGDTWRSRYRSLCLHDPIWACHMPYLPFPENFPVFLPKDQMGDWLESYASIMEIDFWGSTEARSARHDGGGWTVEVRREGKPVTLRPTQLVLATGMAGAPSMPELPGAADFRGRQMHSSAYRSGAEFTGQRCVVLGSNNSAHDIAADLWEHGAQVTMLQRSSTTVVKIDSLMKFGVGKLFSQQAVDSGITTEQADFMMASRPFRLSAAIQKGIYDQIRAHDADFYAGLEKAGFLLDFGEDETGHSMKYFRRGSGYYIDVGACGLVASGDIALRSGVSVKRLLPQGIELSTGEVLVADLLVHATGFDPMESWIAKLISPEVAEKVGHVWGLGSGTAKDPGPWAGELRNMWKPTAQQGLWLMGGNLAQARFYSRILALQIKARQEGLVAG